MQLTSRPTGTVVASDFHEDLDMLVRDMNRLESRSSLAFIQAIGELVIQRVYGSLSEWKQQGRSHPTYRQLASHPSLNMSASTLYRALQVFEMLEKLGWPSLRIVCASHLYALIPLSHEQRLHYLQRVESEELTVRALQQLIRSHGEAKSTTGRPRTPEPLRRLQAFCRVTEGMADMEVDRTTFKLMPTHERRVLVNEVNQGIEALEQLRDELVKSIQRRGAWT